MLWLGWEDTYTPRRMQEAAQTRGVDMTTVEVPAITFVAKDGDIGAFYQGRSLVNEFDVLVARTFHPHISEALTVARIFSDAGKTVVDESLTDEGFVVSKMHDYLILAGNNVPVPRTWQTFDAGLAEHIAGSLGYPCVLKGVHGSHGVHVHLAENAEQLRYRLSTYPAGELMLQEYLPATQDYRVLVIGYHALPAIVSRHPAPGDFRTNVGLSHDSAGIRLANHDSLAAIAEGAARALRREFAGVDIRYRGKEPVVLEVNRRPIFENFERVTGHDVAGTFLDYVLRRMQT